jgi:hypothetical protein
MIRIIFLDLGPPVDAGGSLFQANGFGSQSKRVECSQRVSSQYSFAQTKASLCRKEVS